MIWTCFYDFYWGKTSSWVYQINIIFQSKWNLLHLLNIHYILNVIFIFTCSDFCQLFLNLFDITLTYSPLLLCHFLKSEVLIGSIWFDILRSHAHMREWEKEYHLNLSLVIGDRESLFHTLISSKTECSGAGAKTKINTIKREITYLILFKMAGLKNYTWHLHIFQLYDIMSNII